MTVYKDLENEYKFLDFSLSHSKLLMRSMKNKNRNYNIDILFKGVAMIILPTTLSGIEIVAPELNLVRSVCLNEYEMDTEKFIFNIKDSNGKTCYINAVAFGVFHNMLEILETSIDRYDFSYPSEQVLWFNGK